MIVPDGHRSKREYKKRLKRARRTGQPIGWWSPGEACSCRVVYILFPDGRQFEKHLDKDCRIDKALKGEWGWGSSREMENEEE